jgi:hypothetical protein
MDIPFATLRMHSITNPHLHNDPCAIITFPDETIGLAACRT